MSESMDEFLIIGDAALDLELGKIVGGVGFGVRISANI